jgi:hypothetical protein
MKARNLSLLEQLGLSQPLNTGSVNGMDAIHCNNDSSAAPVTTPPSQPAATTTKSPQPARAPVITPPSLPMSLSNVTQSTHNNVDGEALTRKRLSGPKQHPPPTYKATVIRCPEPRPIRTSNPSADSGALEKLRKCIERAQHPGSNENVVKAALFSAAQLMRRYNISQADLIIDLNAVDLSKYIDHSVVKIQRADGRPDKRMSRCAYLNNLGYGIRRYFDCSGYSSKANNGTKITETFVGIAENAAAAANAYAMVYNSMADWARGTSGKYSYFTGFCEELADDADREKEEEEARAKKRDEEKAGRKLLEEAKKQQQHQRLTNGPVNGGCGDSTQAVARATPPPDHGDPDAGVTDDGTGSMAHQYNATVEDADGDDDDNANSKDGMHSYDVHDSEDDVEMLDDDPSDDDVCDDMVVDFVEDFDDDDDAIITGFEDIDDHISVLAAGMNRSPEASRMSNELSPARSPTPPARSPMPPATTPDENNEQSQQAVASTMNEAVKDAVQPVPPGEGPTWESHEQLVQFRKKTQDAAKDYIENVLNVKKLTKPRKCRAKNLDRMAFHKGRMDSKRVDIRGRKKITAGTDDEVRSGEN